MSKTLDTLLELTCYSGSTDQRRGGVGHAL
jgi:hypothetical protein